MKISVLAWLTPATGFPGGQANSNGFTASLAAKPFELTNQFSATRLLRNCFGAKEEQAGKFYEECN